MTDSPEREAADAFASEVSHWRKLRGLSMKQLARQMGVDPSYVSHVEGRRHRPALTFARRADSVLGARGAILRRFEAYRMAVGDNRPTAEATNDFWLPDERGLVVENETAELRYADGYYFCRVRRRLRNAGDEPVVRYPVRIDVDRFPEDAKRSRNFYRANPLTLDELEFSATLGTDRPEPVTWFVRHDRDAYKKLVVLFESEGEGVRLPLYGGEETTIEWSYRVPERKWGPWFQREVRWPTHSLAVRLALPAAAAPAVWGTETSVNRYAPLRRAISHRDDDDMAVFEWFTDRPSLRAQYRLEWRFRRPPHGLPGRSAA
jgi:transcriptional regulator with XRE-family HTH domain